MVKFDYDFKKNASNPQRQNELRNRRVRLTVLFCSVAAITAIVIFAIIPSGSQSAPDKKTDSDSTIVAENGSPSDSGSTRPAAGTTGNTAISSNIAPQYSGQTDSGAEAQLRTALNAGDFKKFFQLADQFISATAPDSAARASLGAILTEGRKKAWQSGKWKESALLYRAVSGDNLSRIANKNHTTKEIIAACNNLDPNHVIRISQRFYIIPGPWEVVISQKAQLLTLQQQGHVFAVFKVAVNDKKKLPIGEFSVRTKIESPAYNDRQGRKWEKNSQPNMLGDAVIYLRNKNTKKGFYAIHGVSPQNRSVNDNSIQMHNDDIRMLYNLIPHRTKVKVID